MFDITTNQVIKINKGDDSGVFPLYLNMGTAYTPIQYKFFTELSIFESPEQLETNINTKFIKNLKLSDGIYDFEYNYSYDTTGHKNGPLGWYLDGKLVELSNYGITIEGIPKTADHITIAQFINNPSEIYLYILNVNADLDQWLVKKTFSSNGEVFTEFKDCNLSTVENDRTTVDTDHNMLLSIESDDTKYLRSGEYCYQLKGKLYDLDSNNYSINTITSRLPFYIVDGADSMVW